MENLISLKDKDFELTLRDLDVISDLIQQRMEEIEDGVYDLSSKKKAKKLEELFLLGGKFDELYPKGYERKLEYIPRASLS